MNVKVFLGRTNSLAKTEIVRCILCFFVCVFRLQKMKCCCKGNADHESQKASQQKSYVNISTIEMKFSVIYILTLLHIFISDVDVQMGVNHSWPLLCPLYKNK